MIELEGGVVSGKDLARNDIDPCDPQFGLAAAECLVRHLPEGLVLCPVTYIELAPEFRGDSALQEEFFQKAGGGVARALDPPGYAKRVSLVGPLRRAGNPGTPPPQEYPHDVRYTHVGYEADPGARRRTQPSF